MSTTGAVTYARYTRGAIFANDENQVRYFTGMTHEELFDLKCDLGKRWLEVWFNAAEVDESAEEWWELPEIKQIWNLHWRKVDHEWIVPILHKVQAAEVENVYRDMHYSVFDHKSTYYNYLSMAMYRAMRRVLKNSTKK